MIIVIYNEEGEVIDPSTVFLEFLSELVEIVQDESKLQLTAIECAGLSARETRPGPVL